VDVEVGALLDEISHSYPEKSVHLKFFRCTLTAGEPQPIHCHALAWVTQKQLREYEFPAADVQLLAMLEGNTAVWRA
jgi:hypothetical protein